MSKADNNKLTNMLDQETHKNIKDLFNSAKPGDEFEIMMFNFNKIYLSMEKYITVLKYLNRRAKIQKLATVETDTLDVNYTDTSSLYFVSLSMVSVI